MLYYIILYPHNVLKLIHALSGLTYAPLPRFACFACPRQHADNAMVANGGKRRGEVLSSHGQMDWRSTNSLDWFKGKSTGNPWFLPSNIGLSCKFSHHPIL